MSTSEPLARPPRVWTVLLIAALVAGAVLRLVWVGDMEYKRDEAWLFERARLASSEPFPWLGIQSSMVVRQPGMSVWVFQGLATVFPTDAPTSLVRGVQLLNIAAILLLVAFALRAVPRDQREPWLWAAALISVNPLVVLFHRKLWQPSTVSLFSLATVVGWWYRSRWWGAFLWGLVGACLAQIQLPGAFLTGGFLLWALLLDRTRVRWTGFVSGAAIGALPILPWLTYFVRNTSTVSGTLEPRRLTTVWEFWITEPFGTGLRFPLGIHFADFLTYPIVGGQPTHLVWLLNGMAGALMCGVLLLALVRIVRERPRLSDLFVGRSVATVFTLNAAFFGFGILLMASRLFIQRHYMVVTFPLEFVWITWVALRTAATTPQDVTRGRLVLLASGVVQLLLTVSFLGYIHVNGGAPRGDYGVSYRLQPQPNPSIAEEIEKMERPWPSER